jgi:oligopeptide/dipeptide ABC transporter ATP-binding protein
MIALATASRPRLLLADEPTTALDVTTQAQILGLICRLRDERGMGVLIVSHDFGVIAQVCDRVAVMYGGYIVESAPIATIYEHAEHPYTRALLESVPELESAGAVRRRPGITGAPPELSEITAGCPFMARCAYAQDSCAAVSMDLEPVGAEHVSACPVRPFSPTPDTSTSSLERVA